MQQQTTVSSMLFTPLKIPASTAHREPRFGKSSRTISFSFFSGNQRNCLVRIPCSSVPQDFIPKGKVWWLFRLFQKRWLVKKFHFWRSRGQKHHVSVKSFVQNDPHDVIFCRLGWWSGGWVQSQCSPCFRIRFSIRDTHDTRYAV